MRSMYLYNAWGKVLEEAGQDEYQAEWNQYLSLYSDAYLEKQKVGYKQWLADGKPGPKRWEPKDVRTGQKCPANIYNGVLHPTIVTNQSERLRQMRMVPHTHPHTHSRF